KEYDGSTLKRTTITEYFPNSTNNIVSKPARVSLYDGGGACKAETRTVYLDYGDPNHSHYLSYQTPPQTGVVAKTEQALSSCSTATTIGARDLAWSVTLLDADLYGNQTSVYSVGAATDG